MTAASPGPTPSEDLPALRRARWLSRVLDDLFRVPGTSLRFGLDPLLGLLPGLGDWVGMVASLDLLVSAARRGAGAAVLARMLGNLALDALVGSVPVLGDVFDLGWKANRRNLALLEALHADPDRTRRRSGWVVAMVLGVAFTVAAGGVWVGWKVLVALYGWLSGAL